MSRRKVVPHVTRYDLAAVLGFVRLPALYFAFLSVATATYPIFVENREPSADARRDDLSTPR